MLMGAYHAYGSLLGTPRAAWREGVSGVGRAVHLFGRAMLEGNAPRGVGLMAREPRGIGRGLSPMVCMYMALRCGEGCTRTQGVLEGGEGQRPR